MLQCYRTLFQEIDGKLGLMEELTSENDETSDVEELFILVSWSWQNLVTTSKTKQTNQNAYLARFMMQGHKIILWARENLRSRTCFRSCNTNRDLPKSMISGSVTLTVGLARRDKYLMYFLYSRCVCVYKFVPKQLCSPFHYGVRSRLSPSFL